MRRIIRDEVNYSITIERILESGTPTRFSPSLSGNTVTIYDEALLRTQINTEFTQLADAQGNGFATALECYTYLQGVFSSFENVTFETVSKNLRSWEKELVYTGKILTSANYTKGTSTIVKTFTYTAKQLTSVVLSGDTPNGINLTKTLTYTGKNLTNISYS